MGSINTEVVQVTTKNEPATPTAETASTAMSVNWFDGPQEDGPQMDGSASSASPNPYHTITRITADPAPHQSLMTRVRISVRGWLSKFNNMDPVKLAYMRTSFVFAISVFVTWTPSSINRVHDIVYEDSVNFGLNLASAIVLPLQGVWNAVIFCSTSWTVLRDEMRARRDACRGFPRGHHAANAMRKERERERAFEMARKLGRRLGRDDAGSDISTTVTLSHGGNIGGTMRVMRDGSLGSL
jgi:hypothetical protein